MRLPGPVRWLVDRVRAPFRQRYERRIAQIQEEIQAEHEDLDARIKDYRERVQNLLLAGRIVNRQWDQQKRAAAKPKGSH